MLAALGSFEMQLNAGKVTVNKPVEQVYAFLTRFENLEKQLPEKLIPDYEIEFDDDLEGDFKIGDIVSLYLFAIYEGDDDKCCDLKIEKLVPNTEIGFEIVYLGKFDEEKDDWSDPVPLKNLMGAVGAEMRLIPIGEKTQIKLMSLVEPPSKCFGVIMRFLNFLARLGSKRHMKDWGQVIEKYA